VVQFLGSTSFLGRQARLPEASGVYLAAEKDGWQCERQTHVFLQAVRRVCRDHGQTFLGYDNLQWGDDTVHGLGDIQDFPLGIGAKLRRWHALQADGVFDHWGGMNENLSCNTVACREFFLNPTADAAQVCHAIACRQFGPRAGELTFQAWQALEQAHALLSDVCTWLPEQWPGWYQSRVTPPLPDLFSTERLRASRLLPHQSVDGVPLNPDDLALALQAVAQLREDAAACRAAANLFRALGKPKAWPAQYEAKARGIEGFLAVPGHAD